MLSQIDTWDWIGVSDPGIEPERRAEKIWDDRSLDMAAYTRAKAEVLRVRIEALKRLPPGSRLELWAVL